MDIKARLAEEHSKSLTHKIVASVGNDKERFNELILIFLGDDRRLAQRASWPLSYVLIRYPHLLNPYFDVFIEKLDDGNNHPAIIRNILRVLQEIDIPETYHGVLVDKSFKFILSETQPAAIRAFALTVASRICKPYPELVNELRLILNELAVLPQLPSMRSRLKKALKELAAV